MKEAITLLTAFGFTQKDARKIARRAYENGLSLTDIQAWIDEAQTSASLTNPLGFVRARLQSGEKLPERSLADRHIAQRHRYQRWSAHLNNTTSNAEHIETRICACGRVMWADLLCEDCGLCSNCCTCKALSLDEE